MTSPLTFRATTGSNVQADEKCSQCDDYAWRTIGTKAFCHDCFEDLLQPIRHRVFLPEGFDGTGKATGARPDFGAGYHDLECNQCEATWVGRANEHCSYCAGMYTRSLEEQKRLLLRPDLPDIAADSRTAALDAWADRLATAVAAEVVTRPQARQAFNREAKKAEHHAA